MAQASSAIVAGFIPLIAMMLFRFYDSIVPVVILMIGLSTISAIALYWVRRLGGHLDA